MNKTLSLAPEQLRLLSYAIGDLYHSEGVKATGLEVTRVDDEDGYCAAYYTYEIQRSGQWVERIGEIFFTAKFLDHKVEDFQEVNPIDKLPRRRYNFG